MTNEARSVRKHTAQYDLFNRLHSIAADQAFVRSIGEHYDGRFPVVANQRCGTWYCADYSDTLGIYAYFKSTDGHTSNWDFNLRRANIPLVSQIEKAGGIILVDSTRRGKRMPDALSKTVPIWCAVINRAVAETHGVELDQSLYLPPSIVSGSEKNQIEALLPIWVETLTDSPLELPRLDKALRPFFVHPSTRSLPHIPTTQEASTDDIDSTHFIPLICVSASRWVGSKSDDIPTFTRLGRQTVGFEYVPGAGDDDELWARGLTPKLFHRHRDMLLQTSREDLSAVVDSLVADSLAGHLDQLELNDNGRASAQKPSSYLVQVSESGSRLVLDLGPPVSSAPRWTGSDIRTTTVRVFQVDKPLRGGVSILPFNSRATDYVLALPNPRVDSKAYISATTELLATIQRDDIQGPVILAPGSQAHLDAALALASPDQKPEGSLPALVDWQPSGDEIIKSRKIILPLALAVLGNDARSHGEELSKETVARDLQRLVSLWPDGNPPRVALKRVNEVLLSNFR